MFEGYIYRVDLEAYATELILLPDGRVLAVEDWKLGFPPEPEEFSVVVGLTAHPNAMPAVVEGPNSS